MPSPHELALEVLEASERLEPSTSGSFSVAALEISRRAVELSPSTAAAYATLSMM